MIDALIKIYQNIQFNELQILVKQTIVDQNFGDLKMWRFMLSIWCMCVRWYVLCVM